jgi:hypothetical protein
VFADVVNDADEGWLHQDFGLPPTGNICEFWLHYFMKD